jgi:uncharacterized protein (TIGR02145 family)
VSINLIPATNGLSIITLDVSFNDGLTYTETSNSSEINFNYKVNCVPDSRADSINIFSTCKVDECPNCVAQDVIIGTQTWAKCNLDVITYSDGAPIPQVTDPNDWLALTTGAWCYYENNIDNNITYGKLYNWFAVNDPRGLAPIGYSVPSGAEWDILINYLGGSSVAGGKLKEEGLCHWLTPNTDATNESNFTALPGGFRNAYTGDYFNDGINGQFWTSTPESIDSAFARNMVYLFGWVNTAVYGKNFGYSVRCIKN